MKKEKSILKYALAIILFSLSSCESWINVTPTDRLSEEMLFDSKEGFVKALNGIYIELNTSQLYGQNLTVGAVDIMGQYYTYNGSSTHRFYKIAILDYSDSSEKALFDAMWKKCYNVIANCNTIIEKCEAPESPLTEPYASMIKGEAIALRAMLHFDMLRLFGPLTSELDKAGIPYQTSSKQEVTPLLSGTKVMERITADLKVAVDLLATSDPYLAEDKSLYSEVDVNNRQYRLNYFAAKALLARVYLWEGNKPKAYQTANEVIDQAQKGTKVIFPFVTNSAATSTSAPDRVFSSEVLFAAYNSLREKDIQSELFIPTLEPNYRFTFAGSLNSGRVDELYDDKNDYRYKIWATYNNNGSEVLYHRKFENVNSSSTLNYMVPMIRLSEMYLIAAECANTIEDASSYFNQLRNARNCISLKLTEDGLINALAAEYRKEMLGEGQIFFFYKRQRMVNIPNGDKASGMMNVDLAKYVIPLPDSETSERTNE